MDATRGTWRNVIAVVVYVMIAVGVMTVDVVDLVVTVAVMIGFSEIRHFKLFRRFFG